MAVLFLVCIGVLARCLNSFLSVNHPITADVLIVEGWLPDYAMHGAVEEFKRGRYKYILTSGEADPDLRLWSRYETWADAAAADLGRMGIQTNFIIPVPSVYHTRDRTYSSAMAVKEWLASRGDEVRAVNVYSLAAHARRTRLLFQKALGSKVKVGIFAHPDNAYDAKRWWATSEGVRDVEAETTAYLYARCVFPFVSKESKE
jgi:hypothetical protein